ncbi:MAG TPA: hypothetical protein VGM82_05285 [Gemmatimonadaceae bacterium]
MARDDAGRRDFLRRKTRGVVVNLLGELPSAVEQMLGVATAVAVGRALRRA